MRVVAVNAFYVGSLYQQVGIEFRSPQRRAGICRKEGIAGTTCQYDDPAVFEVSQRA